MTVPIVALLGLLLFGTALWILINDDEEGGL